MPGRDFISTTSNISTSTDVDMEIEAPRAGVYYNARLDPKNYLEGPLSHNAATRLRQMLARPGIVVSSSSSTPRYDDLNIIISQCAPGICDGISARVALEAGFDCLYQRSVLETE